MYVCTLFNSSLASGAGPPSLVNGPIILLCMYVCMYVRL